MNNANDHISKAKELFKKLEIIRREQDALLEKESVIRVKLQKIYNDQTRRAGKGA